MTFDPQTRDVILEMVTCDHERPVPYVRELAEDLGLPVERLRHILRALGEQGLATYGPLFDLDDGRPRGSSWWLTERGAALQRQLEGVDA